MAGGGVPPSSGLTSKNVRVMAAMSSPMRSSEFTVPDSALFDVVSHSAFSCSLSGGLDGESFSENIRGEGFDQGELFIEWVLTGVASA